jgi:heme/copper-type cytochrome/quinol oxidase subunit 4
MDIFTYSLNFNDKFGFESEKLYNYIVQTGGGDSIFSCLLHLVMGIIIIIIGLILYYQNTLVSKTTATILNIQENDTYNTLTLEYMVNDKLYKNKMNISNHNYRIGDKIEILYENSNYNVIKLYLINVFVISIILNILGLWMIINSFTYSYNDNNYNKFNNSDQILSENIKVNYN